MRFPSTGPDFFRSDTHTHIEIVPEYSHKIELPQYFPFLLSRWLDSEHLTKIEVPAKWLTSLRILLV